MNVIFDDIWYLTKRYLTKKDLEQLRREIKEIQKAGINEHTKRALENRWERLAYNHSKELLSKLKHVGDVKVFDYLAQDTYDSDEFKLATYLSHYEKSWLSLTYAQLLIAKSSLDMIETLITDEMKKRKIILKCSKEEPDESKNCKIVAFKKTGKGTEE